jgi:hypothetical protein
MAKDEEKEELPLDIHIDKIAEWLEARGLIQSFSLVCLHLCLPLACPLPAPCHLSSANAPLPDFSQPSKQHSYNTHLGKLDKKEWPNAVKAVKNQVR